MQAPPNITYRNIDASPAIEDHVRRRIEELETRFDRIVGCDVVIEAPQKKKRSGRVFSVHLTVHIPGPDISASSTVGMERPRKTSISPSIRPSTLPRDSSSSTSASGRDTELWPR